MHTSSEDHVFIKFNTKISEALERNPHICKGEILIYVERRSHA